MIGVKEYHYGFKFYDVDNKLILKCGAKLTDYITLKLQPDEKIIDVDGG